MPDELPLDADDGEPAQAEMELDEPDSDEEGERSKPAPRTTRPRTTTAPPRKPETLASDVPMKGSDRSRCPWVSRRG